MAGFHLISGEPGKPGNETKIRETGLFVVWLARDSCDCPRAGRVFYSYSCTGREWAHVDSAIVLLTVWLPG